MTVEGFTQKHFWVITYFLTLSTWENILSKLAINLLNLSSQPSCFIIASKTSTVQAERLGLRRLWLRLARLLSLLVEGQTQGFFLPPAFQG
jgi:hypothetical protein